MYGRLIHHHPNMAVCHSTAVSFCVFFHILCINHSIRNPRNLICLICQKVDADSLYSSAAMTGSVVEFSDGSCTVSVAVTEDDGKTGVVAAPGYESEDTNVVVTYQEGCVVQIATIIPAICIATRMRRIHHFA